MGTSSNRYWAKLEAMFDLGDRFGKMSACKRLAVGCVIFPPDCSGVHALGYNGPASGEDDDACTGNVGGCGCPHAEMNACAKLDSRTVRGAVLYTTHSPCRLCAGLIINTKAISKVVYLQTYRELDGLVRLANAGICCYARADVFRGFHGHEDAAAVAAMEGMRR